MSTNNLSTWLKYANLQMASEAILLSAGISGTSYQTALTPAAYAKSLTQKSGKLPTDSKALCY